MTDKFKDRRNFLKVAGVGLATLAFKPFKFDEYKDNDPIFKNIKIETFLDNNTNRYSAELNGTANVLEISSDFPDHNTQPVKSYQRVDNPDTGVVTQAVLLENGTCLLKFEALDQVPYTRVLPPRGDKILDYEVLDDHCLAIKYEYTDPYNKSIKIVTQYSQYDGLTYKSFITPYDSTNEQPQTGDLDIKNTNRGQYIPTSFFHQGISLGAVSQEIKFGRLVKKFFIMNNNSFEKKLTVSKSDTANQYNTETGLFPAALLLADEAIGFMTSEGGNTEAVNKSFFHVISADGERTTLELSAPRAATLIKSENIDMSGTNSVEEVNKLLDKINYTGDRSNLAGVFKINQRTKEGSDDIPWILVFKDQYGKYTIKELEIPQDIIVKQFRNLRPTPKDLPPKNES